MKGLLLSLGYGHRPLRILSWCELKPDSSTNSGNSERKSKTLLSPFPQHIPYTSHEMQSKKIIGCFVAATLLTTCTLAAFSQAPSAPPLATDCSVYANIPLPPEATALPTPKTYPACASYRSYRGIGRPVNYAQARSCAWKERLAQKARLRQNLQEPTSWVVGGSLILADIYFNGAGVPRNIPLALRFACESEERLAQLAIPEINKLGGSSTAHPPFEFCDYAATTFTMNFCTGYATEIADNRRSRYYSSLKSSMTPAQKAAFESLLAAQNTYVDTHALEVDQGGTIRAMRTMGSEDILNDLFRTELVHFERMQWPALSQQQIAVSDALLQRQYEKTLQQLRKQTKDDIEGGAVTAENVAKVEAAWQTYRDAWSAFAKLRYPDQATAIRAQITLDRYRLLKTIRSYE